MSHQIGYCTNVHAGADLEETRHNLQEHAVAVKEKFLPNSEMGIGRWLSANSAEQLLAVDRIHEFADWLGDRGLLPFTLNGFPYGNFHQAVVKHRVYEPTWYEPARLKYTLDLIEILDQILPPGHEGSISTLPICWGSPGPSDQQLRTATEQLRQVADQLAELENTSGRLIYVCIEPEPGCFLQRSQDIVSLFNDHLLPGGSEERIRRHIRVCHDVCHAAVMFEQQDDVLARFRAEGILVGKVQVSSAVYVDFAAIEPGVRGRAIEQLSDFAEDRYLHQTTVHKTGGEEVFFEDLPSALSSVEDPKTLTDQWCIHFHVPVYLERFDHLRTSQPQIKECLKAIRHHPELSHFEVETYAWSVLPGELKQPSLARGIANELEWFARELRS